jgi:hypothetical protein
MEIPVCHMNVTAKDNTIISETAYFKRYSLPLGNGQKGDKENRPRDFFQGKTLF